MIIRCSAFMSFQSRWAPCTAHCSTMYMYHVPILTRIESKNDCNGWGQSAQMTLCCLVSLLLPNALLFFPPTMSVSAVHCTGEICTISLWFRAHTKQHQMNYNVQKAVVNENGWRGEEGKTLPLSKLSHTARGTGDFFFCSLPYTNVW